MLRQDQLVEFHPHTRVKKAQLKRAGSWLSTVQIYTEYEIKLHKHGASMAATIKGSTQKERKKIMLDFMLVHQDEGARQAVSGEKRERISDCKRLLQIKELYPIWPPTVHCWKILFGLQSVSHSIFSL